MLKYQMKCTVCRKRVFDISALKDVPIVIELKCPHCKNIVRVVCTKNNSDVPSNGS